jgi:uncharacterized Zn-binding protein involved in type VI secretion
MTDKAMHDGPHCHAPIHPPGPVPTPMPHPPMPIDIMQACVQTVMIDNLPAAVVSSMTLPCMIPSCVPGGPGMVAKGSATVMIGNLPAARLGDMMAFATCVGPIPGPTGKIIPPCSPTVMIGG